MHLCDCWQTALQSARYESLGLCGFLLLHFLRAASRNQGSVSHYPALGRAGIARRPLWPRRPGRGRGRRPWRVGYWPVLEDAGEACGGDAAEVHFLLDGAPEG